MVEQIEHYLEKPALKKSKLKRCLLCGKDKDILMPQKLKVNQATFQKIGEIATEFSNVHLNNTEFHNPHIDGTVDDLTLKPIKGMSFEVFIDICLDCIDMIGHRHKFKKKYINTQYATKLI